jgi:flotillin
VLNGAQGISEIIAQVIGQAGPALEMARDALARTRNGDGAAKLRAPEEPPRA